MLTIGEFCSSTTLSGLRKLSDSTSLLPSARRVKFEDRRAGSGPSDDGDLGIAELEAVPVGRLRAKLRRARQCAAVKERGRAEAGAKSKQGSSRNVYCHGFSSAVFFEFKRVVARNRSAPAT